MNQPIQAQTDQEYTVTLDSGIIYATTLYNIHGLRHSESEIMLS